MLILLAFSYIERALNAPLLSEPVCNDFFVIIDFYRQINAKIIVIQHFYYKAKIFSNFQSKNIAC